MKYAQINKDFNVHIQFIVDGQLVVPTSASYTLKKNDGSVVNSLEDETITLTANTSEITLTIPAVANAVTLDNEVRYFDYKFVYEGITYNQSLFYILKESLNIPVDPKTVVVELGLPVDDYSLSQVDLIKALEEVEEDTEIDVSGAITGGTANLPYALSLIKTKAALGLAETLELQIFQSEQGDNTLYRRFEEVDFDAIRKRLQQRYSSLLDKIEAADPVIPIISLIALGDDPVTGGT